MRLLYERGWGRSRVIHRLLVLATLSLLFFSPVYASSTTVNPRAVNPYGVNFNDTSGAVIPTASELFVSIGICADKPNPTSVLGYPCFNGSGNDTMYFIYRGFELTQKIYTFSVQAYANATGSHILVLRFPGNVPSRIIGTTISSRAFDYGNGWQQVIFTAGTTDPVFTIIFSSGADQLANAAILGSVFWGVIFISLGALTGVTIFQYILVPFTGRQPFLSSQKTFIISIATVIGWGLTIIIVALLSGSLRGMGI